MKGLGLHCSIRNDRPHVVGVLAEHEQTGTPQATRVFSHLADPQEDLPLQLTNLSLAIASQIPKIAPDAIVVRAQDFSQRGMRARVVQRNNQVVGILLAIGRRHCETTRLMSGKDIGAALGISKTQAEEQAAGLAGADYKEAGAAALAALRVAEA